MTLKTFAIVEDSDDDFEAVTRVLNKENPDSCKINRYNTGDELLQHLDKCLNENLPLPSLVLLDLNMPGTDGRSVLQQIKKHVNLKHLPIIIMTTSDAANDIEECYKYGANAYVTKAISFDHFSKRLIMLKEFWFNVAELPQ